MCGCLCVLNTSYLKDGHEKNNEQHERIFISSKIIK